MTILKFNKKDLIARLKVFEVHVADDLGPKVMLSQDKDLARIFCKSRDYVLLRESTKWKLTENNLIDYLTGCLNSNEFRHLFN